jgi:beta-lactamase superfamily II metal-dependent hydrolase
VTAFFEVKLIQAEHGDAILVSYGQDPVRHMLIDGGPTSSVSNLLEVLEASRTNGVLTLEAVVVTHYDLDHIGGIIALLEDIPNWLTINDIWFNGYKHLLPEDTLGPRHSEFLADLIIDKQLPWNKAFRESAIYNSLIESVELSGGMSISVMSPTRTGLSALAKHERANSLADGDSKIEADRLGRKDPWPPPTFASLIASRYIPDRSISNASSLALLLNFLEKQILLCGDALPEVICDSLKPRCPEKKLKLDLLKISHHGSQASTSAAFLGLIECKRFAFSTNGKIHAHPDQALVARIVGSTYNPELIFNYANPWTSRWNNRPAAWPMYRTLYPQGHEPFVRVAL